MNISKILCGLSLLGTISIEICRADGGPSVIASTNYVSTNGSLHVTGFGFLAFDYVKVLIDDYRAPKFAFYTDANGAFDMDLTYGGPYRIPDVQYRFSNSSYAEPSFTVHYQAGETVWHAVVAPDIVFEPPEVIGTNVIPWVKVSALVARGGHAYQFLMATNVSGPWMLVGRTWTNDTWSDDTFTSDFPVPISPRAYFRVTDPTTYASKD